MERLRVIQTIVKSHTQEEMSFLSEQYLFSDPFTFEVAEGDEKKEKSVLDYFVGMEEFGSDAPLIRYSCHHFVPQWSISICFVSDQKLYYFLILISLSLQSHPKANGVHFSVGKTESIPTHRRHRPHRLPSEELQKPIHLPYSVLLTLVSQRTGGVCVIPEVMSSGRENKIFEE
jgi:hypothetical protein